MRGNIIKGGVIRRDILETVSSDPVIKPTASQTLGSILISFISPGRIYFRQLRSHGRHPLPQTNRLPYKEHFRRPQVNQNWVQPPAGHV